MRCWFRKRRPPPDLEDLRAFQTLALNSANLNGLELTKLRREFDDFRKECRESFEFLTRVACEPMRFEGGFAQVTRESPNAPSDE